MTILSLIIQYDVHFLSSGQSSACLDLARLNWSLVDTMIQRKVDLIVLEGMGRAVHTNYYANFNCECLKVISIYIIICYII